MNGVKKILIIRFSAMGDVVLTVPVIKNLLKHYPHLEIVVVTRPFFYPFFENIPQVVCFKADLKEKHKGIFGLFRLVNEIIKTEKIDLVFDLHSVLRTWILGFFFEIKGIRVFRIDKGRKEKKLFVKNKNTIALKHTTERYREVFQKADFDFPMEKELLSNDFSQPKNVGVIKIGIAPFAAHQSKQWGLNKIYELIETINKQYTVEFYLFGGGKYEVEELEKVAAYYKNVFNVAGTLKLVEEIHKIAEMTVFVSMDSGNMHIATLTGVPVISIWGGTHPNVGFSGLYQPLENQIQLSAEQIDCRPCSVFGTSKCANIKSFSCMKDLEVIHVMERLKTYID